MGNISGTTGVNEESFNALAKLAYDESGLILVPEKFLMVQSRLRPRMKTLGLTSIEQYQRLVCSESGHEERRHMISALTTNVSHFFREAHHFDLLKDCIGQRVRNSSGENLRVRVWSAGCSNGQEAISIAITLTKAYPILEKSDFRILATDIDRSVVSFARAGEYTEKMVSGLSEEDLGTYFEKTIQDDELQYRVKNGIRDLISFKELNLLAEWPMNQKFDAIFCRNVVIYFDNKTQTNLWPRFRNKISPGGLFFLGHSERMVDPEAVGFESIGPTAYKLNKNGTENGFGG